MAASHDRTRDLDTILRLLEAAGYDDARRPDISDSDKIVAGLTICISAVRSLNPPSDNVTIETSTHLEEIEAGLGIEEALKSIKCPYFLRASQIQNVDCEVLLPVVQWLLSNANQMSSNEEKEINLQLLEDELRKARASVKILKSKLDEQNERNLNATNELQRLQEKINEAGANRAVEKLISLMESLKGFERKELEFQSECDAKRCQLQAEIMEFEDLSETGSGGTSISVFLNHLLRGSLENLNQKKKELTARLREVLYVSRQLDNAPTQAEIIQYECRSSELFTQIQEKHRQTQKCYATYNALLEIKELMHKEISLLNSISSQFQNAITTASGRVKLIGSMEGILKSSLQKLEKVQNAFHQDQKICDALKAKYTEATVERRLSFSIDHFSGKLYAKNTD